MLSYVLGKSRNEGMTCTLIEFSNKAVTLNFLFYLSIVLLSSHTYFCINSGLSPFVDSRKGLSGKNWPLLNPREHSMPFQHPLETLWEQNSLIGSCEALNTFFLERLTFMAAFPWYAIEMPLVQETVHTGIFRKGSRAAKDTWLPWTQDQIKSRIRASVARWSEWFLSLVAVALSVTWAHEMDLASRVYPTWLRLLSL